MKWSLSYKSTDGMTVIWEGGYRTFRLILRLGVIGNSLQYQLYRLTKEKKLETKEDGILTCKMPKRIDKFCDNLGLPYPENHHNEWERIKNVLEKIY